MHLDPQHSKDTWYSVSPFELCRDVGALSRFGVVGLALVAVLRPSVVTSVGLVLVHAHFAIATEAACKTRDIFAKHPQPFEATQWPTAITTGGGDSPSALSLVASRTTVLVTIATVLEIDESLVVLHELTNLKPRKKCQREGKLQTPEQSHQAQTHLRECETLLTLSAKLRAKR